MGTKKPGLGKKLREGAESLVARVPTPGRRADAKVLRDLSATGKGLVPDWFVNLVTEFPLAGLKVGQFVTDTFAGLVNHPVLFEWGDAALIRELNLESYPGMHLFDRGYLTVGCGVEWAGNVLVLRTDSADPPVFEVWHDVSQDPEVLEKAVLEGERGTRLIAKSLSSLFESGLVEAP